MTLPRFKDVADQVGSLFLDADAKQKTCPIWLAQTHKGQDDPAQDLAPRHRAWLKAIDFKPNSGSWALLAGDEGIDGVVFGGDEKYSGAPSPLHAGGLPPLLPAGAYHYAWRLDNPGLTALAWALGHYTFQYYQAGGKRGDRQLRLPEGVDKHDLVTVAAATCLGRDLINIPANDLGPAELETAVRDVAAAFGAECRVIAGDDLLTENFPLIHTVGRASSRPPRLIDMRWGDPAAPKITLVGKGICFDTGGLNIKPGPYMALMKKDMGGAAAALALAAMIMGTRLKVNLRLLIAAAENSISSNAFRPGDVLKSRAGLNVEVGDTDAEGRLVLADALALADAETPDHIISFATLTGAARVALGPDLPPVYSTEDDLAVALTAAGRKVGDPMWPMPFWSPYDQLLESRIADINSIFPEPFAGSIMAALFLKRFVKNTKAYTHFDIYGWVPRAQPGKPVGGEPQCARAVFDYLRGKFPQG
jgi:leucyl aminopeptidase